MQQETQTTLTKAQKLTLIYRHAHRDYKGNSPTMGKTLLVGLNGSSVLISLENLPDELIAEKLPYALVKEAQRLEAVAAKKAKAAPVEDLVCACCGGWTKGRQWHNQDIGFGLGACCVDRVSRTPDDKENLERRYGTAGINYSIAA